MLKQFASLLLLGCLPWTLCQGQSAPRWHIAFWNVENFFDTTHDTLKNDEAFLPMGDNHWTSRRYTDKRDKIYKMIAAMEWPTAIGMAEVENDHVLRDLCYGTPLRRKRYEFIHFESPDLRGVDCALLYRRDLFHPTESRPLRVSDSTANFFTRDILLVGGVLTDGDSCYLLVNHWPSKLGGTEANRHRLAIARLLRHTLDSLQRTHPTALVMAMGDFNASPDEEAIRKGLGFERKRMNPDGFFNLMHDFPKGTGTYKYQDSWSCIDQIIANRDLPTRIFSPEFILIDDSKYLGQKLFRTYIGMQYKGGYSDHLPVIVDIP